MNIPYLVIAFCLAVLVGAIAMTTLARVAPQWTPRRRVFVAAMVLPAVTLLATLAGIVAAMNNDRVDDDGVRDMAIAAIATMGAMSALIAFIGGMIGAALRQKGMRR